MRVEADGGTSGGIRGGLQVGGLNDDGCAVSSVLHNIIEGDARGCEEEETAY